MCIRDRLRGLDRHRDTRDHLPDGTVEREPFTWRYQGTATKIQVASCTTVTGSARCTSPPSTVPPTTTTVPEETTTSSTTPEETTTTEAPRNATVLWAGEVVQRRCEPWVREVVGGSSGRLVPGPETAEAFVETHRRLPLQRFPGLTLIEPVGGPELLCEETGHRRIVVSPSAVPDPLDDETTGARHRIRNVEARRVETGRHHDPIDEFSHGPGPVSYT